MVAVIQSPSGRARWWIQLLEVGLNGCRDIAVDVARTDTLDDAISFERSPDVGFQSGKAEGDAGVPGEADEIGRASCRERVCDSV